MLLLERSLEREAAFLCVCQIAMRQIANTQIESCAGRIVS